MPILRFEIRFSEAERALLAKRAKKAHMSEAELLRVCMVMDAVLEGDRDALGIAFVRARDKAYKRLSKYFAHAEGVPQRA